MFKYYERTEVLIVGAPKLSEHLFSSFIMVS